MILLKGKPTMLNNEKLQKFIENAPNFDDHLIEQLQDPEFQKGWLELTLQEFLEDGDIDTFIRCLTYVVKSRIKFAKRGEISKLARELKLDRSNLSEIVNGNKMPRLETAFKLLNGLGYKYDIVLKSA